MQLDNLNRMKN